MHRRESRGVPGAVIAPHGLDLRRAALRGLTARARTSEADVGNVKDLDSFEAAARVQGHRGVPPSGGGRDQSWLGLGVVRQARVDENGLAPLRISGACRGKLRRLAVGSRARRGEGDAQTRTAQACPAGLRSSWRGTPGRPIKDPALLVDCGSLEASLYRWWFEGSLWYGLTDGAPLTDAQATYVSELSRRFKGALSAR